MTINYSTWTFDSDASNTVESIITDLNSKNIFAHTAIDQNKVNSILSCSIWSVNQAEAAVKLIKKYKKHVNQDFSFDCIVFKNKPTDFDFFINLNSITLHNGTAVFYVKYNPSLIQDIKELRCTDNGKTVWPKWNPQNKTWSILVTDSNVYSIVNLGKKYNLKIDSNLLEKYNEIENKIIEDRTLLLLNDGLHITLAGNNIIIANTNLDIMEKIKNELGISDNQTVATNLDLI